MITPAEEELWVNVEGRTIRVTHPDKQLWPQEGITKWEYILLLQQLAPYLLKHAQNRLLTTIRFPDGIGGDFFYQKNVPEDTPAWIKTFNWHKTRYILLNSVETLIWLANRASLEFHVSFALAGQESPTALVFDLDPSLQNTFLFVQEAALKIHELLQSLELKSYVKTSGASGLQIFIPIRPYPFEKARQVNCFFASYFTQKYPNLFTTERLVKKRRGLVYFDYLQMWQGKTLICAYSPRARPGAPVSAPVSWSELAQGIHPEQFHLKNIVKRLKQQGDLFEMKEQQSLDPFLKFIKDRNLTGD